MAGKEAGHIRTSRGQLRRLKIFTKRHHIGHFTWKIDHSGFFFCISIPDLMTKEELLRELTHNTYVMLRPSPIEGIGVFAIRDIPKGTRTMFSNPSPDDKWIPVSKEEVAKMPPHAQHIITNYSLYDEENYFVPDHGFKKVDICLFLNHSDTPNVVSINDGDYFEAIRDIASGEELLIDYGMIVDGE